MKIFLYILAAIFFIAPILLWGWLVGMACGYSNGSDCASWSRLLDDYRNWEFLLFAALPWLIALVCFVFAKRAGRKAQPDELG